MEGWREKIFVQCYCQIYTISQKTSSRFLIFSPHSGTHDSTLHNVTSIQSFSRQTLCIFLHISMLTLELCTYTEFTFPHDIPSRDGVFNPIDQKIPIYPGKSYLERYNKLKCFEYFDIHVHCINNSASFFSCTNCSDTTVILLSKYWKHCDLSVYCDLQSTYN